MEDHQPLPEQQGSGWGGARVKCVGGLYMWGGARVKCVGGLVEFSAQKQS